MHACIPTDWSQRMIHQITRAGKSLLAAGCTLSILFASDSYAATALNVSQQPLFLTQGVAPNLLFTLDDSGSMAWAYVPDGISGIAAERDVPAITTHCTTTPTMLTKCPRN